MQSSAILIFALSLFAIVMANVHKGDNSNKHAIEGKSDSRRVLQGSQAIVPTVLLATSAKYSVLGATTVTNIGNSILRGSLGLFPGTSITGFPPGTVVPPATTDAANPAAQLAQSDLNKAYLDAASRKIDATTTSNLNNLILLPGVYSGPSKSPLGLTETLVLDGAGDSNSVFIFQTDSTLITGSGSNITLINGTQACNVFWQVGSSATLGTGSKFAGNILAYTSITVATSVSFNGRAFALNGAVTLDNAVFSNASCDVNTGATNTSSPSSSASSSSSSSITSSSPSSSASSSSSSSGSSSSSSSASSSSSTYHSSKKSEDKKGTSHQTKKTTSKGKTSKSDDKKKTYNQTKKTTSKGKTSKSEDNKGTYQAKKSTYGKTPKSEAKKGTYQTSKNEYKSKYTTKQPTTYKKN